MNTVRTFIVVVAVLLGAGCKKSTKEEKPTAAPTRPPRRW
jgi:hypothetical protein